jgi:hypothetical protein
MKKFAEDKYDKNAGKCFIIIFYQFNKCPYNLERSKFKPLKMLLKMTVDNLDRKKNESFNYKNENLLDHFVSLQSPSLGNY